MKDKLITFLLGNLSGGGGGAEKVNVDLINNLSKKGYKVELLLINNKKPYFSDISSNVSIICFSKNRAIYSILDLLIYIIKKKPSLVICSGDHIAILAIFAKFLTFYSFKLIIFKHVLMEASLYDFKTKISKLVIFLSRLLFRFADYVIAVSNGVKNELIKKYKIEKNKLFVIYNPINNVDIQEKCKEKIHDKWFPNNKDIIIAIGRLTKLKDHITLIKAFSKLSKQCDCYLIILGEGEERNNLEKEITKLNLSNKVILPGFVSNPYKYLSKSKVFVSTSIYESFGVAIVEAMECGIPVISTNCKAGPKEIIKNGVNGILVQIGDYKSISINIERILKESSYRNKIISEGHKKASEFYLNKQIILYENIIKKLLKL